MPDARTSPSDSDAARIAARYPTRSNRPALIAGGTLAAIVLVWWLWISFVHSTPALEAKVTGFEVQSPSQIEVTILIDRDSPARTGRCLVYAQSPNFEKVGETWYPVAAAPGKVDTQTLVLKTYRESTSASVDKCVAD